MFARGVVLRYFEKWKEATLKPSREQCAFLQVLHTGSSRRHGGICADLGRLELLKHLGALVYIYIYTYKYEYSYISLSLSLYISLCIYIFTYESNMMQFFSSQRWYLMTLMYLLQSLVFLIETSICRTSRPCWISRCWGGNACVFS